MPKAIIKIQIKILVLSNKNDSPAASGTCQKRLNGELFKTLKCSEHCTKDRLRPFICITYRTSLLIDCFSILKF